MIEGNLEVSSDNRQSMIIDLDKGKAIILNPANQSATELAFPFQGPMAALMQFDLVDAEPGKVVFTCRPDGSVYNPNGGVHGGLVCTLLDSVAGLAVHSTLPAGKGYTSIEIKVNYLKAVRLGAGPLTATGTVVKSGSRVAFTEGVVTDASGAIVATATSTLLVFDL